MRAEHVHNFTRGSDPYRKLNIGRRGVPPTTAEVDRLADDVFFLWDEYFDDDRGGIEQATMNGDQMMWLDIKTMETLSEEERRKFDEALFGMLDKSDMQYATEADDDDVVITIHHKWKK